ncbi:hypothetical protein KSP40_PGU010142 [Platanthera guangdongensis]|uniref:Uncharacterized protein n=1 Tax=Platanthera guangdongensis TaxID=2320717 RepID=A0ABR2LL77_9ASPA
MALDGSFTCEAAILRFLARCPELRSNPKLVSLLQKERPISVVDTVAVVADPFLHPRYTIPILGCFRPICRKILHKVVEKLHSVGSFNSESKEYGEEIGDDDIHVIDFYVRRRRKMKLHELACLAFCRALDLAPFLLS